MAATTSKSVQRHRCGVVVWWDGCCVAPAILICTGCRVQIVAVVYFKLSLFIAATVATAGPSETVGAAVALLVCSVILFHALQSALTRSTLPNLRAAFPAFSEEACVTVRWRSRFSACSASALLLLCAMCCCCPCCVGHRRSAAHSNSQGLHRQCDTRQHHRPR